MTEADIGKPHRIVVADGNIARHVSHVVVDTLVPAHCRGRYEVSIGGQRIFEYSDARCHDWSGHRCQYSGDTRGASAEPTRHAYGELSTKHRLRESIRRRKHDQIALPAQAQIQVYVHIRRNPADL